LCELLLGRLEGLLSRCELSLCPLSRLIELCHLSLSICRPDLKIRERSSYALLLIKLSAQGDLGLLQARCIGTGFLQLPRR
jgi:hypothetical protein